MGHYELFILSSLGLLTLTVVMLASIWKKTLRTMQGMIISMFFGMNVGLTAGVLLGVVYQGNLFLSTVLSMAIGVFAGSICGYVFGSLSILEGWMSGMMGGMMGAMVGEMIRAEQSISLVQIFLILSISTVFVIVILRTPRDSKVQNLKWYLKPVLLSGIIVVYVIAGTSYVRNVDGRTIVPEPHNNHNSPVESYDNINQKVSIEAIDMKYSKDEVIVEKGKPMSLTLINLDDIEHDIEILIPFSNLFNDSKHNHGNRKNVIHLHTAPESSETLTFTPTVPGVYQFVCTIPGHKESGMIGKLVVN